MWRGALGLLVLRGGSPAVRSPGPLVGKVQPELPEDKGGEVQNLAVRRLGPLAGNLGLGSHIQVLEGVRRRLVGAVLLQLLD